MAPILDCNIAVFRLPLFFYTMYGRRDQCLGSIGSFVPVFDKCSCDFSRQLFITKYPFVNDPRVKDARDWKSVLKGQYSFFFEMRLCTKTRWKRTGTILCECFTILKS